MWATPLPRCGRTWWPAASGWRPIQGFDTTGFPVTFAAEVKNFDPLNFVDKKEARKMGRFIHFAFAATQEAMEQLGSEDHAGDRRPGGCFIGSGIGGFEIIEREHTNLLQGRPAQDFALLYSRDHREHGGGADEHSLRRPGADFGHGDGVRDFGQLDWRLGAHDLHGDADAMIAGGSEAAVTPLSVGGFAAMRALSTRNDEPTKASRPFDKDRDGFVIGEGAGIADSRRAGVCPKSAARRSWPR